MVIHTLSKRLKQAFKHWPSVVENEPQERLDPGGNKRASSVGKNNEQNVKIDTETALAQSPLQLYWMDPEEYLGKSVPLWGDWVEHQCVEQGSFVFQRDFCLQKLASQQFFFLGKEEIDDGFYNLLRFLLPPLLLKQGKILFHSSAVVDNDGGAFVFFGHSGAGKTTMAGLCQGGLVLGDDMCILQLKGPDLFVEPAQVGQVFQNPEAFGQTFPVKGLFWLQKSTELSIRPLAFGAIPRVVSSFSGLHWSQVSDEDMTVALQLGQRLARTQKVYELRFPKKEGVWNELRSHWSGKNFSTKTRLPLAKPRWHDSDYCAP